MLSGSAPLLFHLSWDNMKKKKCQQGTFEMSGGFFGISPPNFFLIASSCPQKHYYVQYNPSCHLLKAIWMHGYSITKRVQECH